MRARARFIERHLQSLLDSAPVVALGARHRIVIMSDLHLGDGGPRDGFLRNAELSCAALRDYYLARGYSLVLNGDIEELQKFRADSVFFRWTSLHALFEEFRKRTRFFRIVGNHDEALQHARNGGIAAREGAEVLSALGLSYEGETIFIFHGHQATIFFECFNWLSAILQRYGAKTFRKTGIAASLERGNWRSTEQRVYDFACRRKVIAIIGHTHHPLFESAAVLEDSGGESHREGLHDGKLYVPCLFNSGCATGEHGITTIEILDGTISLVQWLGGSIYHRITHGVDDLSRVFSRIKSRGSTPFDDARESMV